MATTTDRSLTTIEVARILFRTAQPSSKQVYQVYDQMKRGLLPVRDFAGPPLKWTTTESALADFMARRRVDWNTQRHPVEAKPGQLDEFGEFQSMYRGIWRDYFLSVFLRKHMANRSKRFKQAVVVGQVVALMAIIAVFAGSVRFVRGQTNPLLAPINKHLDEITDDFSITRWHPAEPTPDGAGSRVKLEYRYQLESNRWIHTERTFDIVGDSVTEVSLD